MGKKKQGGNDAKSCQKHMYIFFTQFIHFCASKCQVQHMYLFMIKMMRLVEIDAVHL